MKRVIILAVLFGFVGGAEAARRRNSSDDVQVDGYYKKDGTYVDPYYRSKPNANQWDNYGYEPSQPKYNKTRNDPSYGSQWDKPNPGRNNDDNPYNNNPWGN